MMATFSAMLTTTRAAPAAAPLAMDTIAAAAVLRARRR
jgi:hypothetical protein